ncbi:uncharacterized protein G2W53_027709 [Senna tora]|uniref:Uncharacterized protein n=1 Tax=Senna tora TaxID=362788 RepID=A0A834TR68_9FABA|nr:uncharacterized protein G2W53_027709 [Senna tora]
MATTCFAKKEKVMNVGAFFE